MADKQAQSLVGKLINIRPLIPAGRFNVDKIMALLADSSKNKVVHVSDECKRQLKFWELALLACNGRLSIPAVGGSCRWGQRKYIRTRRAGRWRAAQGAPVECAEKGGSSYHGH